MCLVTFMKDVHPDYPLIFITNRDELYDRAAAPIHRWVDYPEVTAGVDLKAYGTWLGYAKNGKFIAVLNHPFEKWAPSLEEPRSRGKLLRDYLTTDISITEFEHILRETRTEYNGYHLIFGTFDDLRYYSNINNVFQNFKTGTHTISNTTDDLSKHRKEYSCALLKNYVDKHKNDLKLDELVQLMQNKEPSEDLEDFPPELSMDIAKEASAIFIKSEEFGTVGTTAILLDKEGRIQVKEVKYSPEKITEITTLEQQLDS